MSTPQRKRSAKTSGAGTHGNTPVYTATNRTTSDTAIRTAFGENRTTNNR